MKDGDETVLLVKPLTFMNLSGRAVRAVLDFYKVPVENLLVVCDDFNLPLGKLRVRAKGSHGGQNGLRNIQDQLGTDAYTRMRLGVGQPRPATRWTSCCRSSNRASGRPSRDYGRDRGAGALVWVRTGAEACMNRFNGGDEKPKRRKKTPDGTSRQRTKAAKPKTRRRAGARTRFCARTTASGAHRDLCTPVSEHMTVAPRPT
jgi:PTH1 family peptidyl-tRNA hydrolase